MPAASLLMRSRTAKCCVKLLSRQHAEHHGVRQQAEENTCDRAAAGAPFDWAGAKREVVTGAEKGRERVAVGVAAERCSEASLTMVALSMTGLSAMNDPDGHSWCQ